jgi:uncharacterized protein (DUF362 family)
MIEKPKVSIVKKKMPVNAADIDGMMRKALDLIGGLSGKFKKGGHVVIKPNLFALSAPHIGGPPGHRLGRDAGP